MRSLYRNKPWIRAGAALLAGTLLAAVPSARAFAASPEFARSEEEWAHLRDNKLEWYEIEDLVHEYNAEVLKAREDLSKDERRSMDSKEVADYLLEEANDYDSMADSSDNALMAATYRTQANSYRTQAESNVVDFEVIRLESRRSEKNTFRMVQELFLQYYQALEARDGAQASLAYLERAYNSAVNRKNAGMGTQLEVLGAQEALENARAGLITAESDIRTTYTNLQVLCGWSYDSAAEIGELPQMDPASIAGIAYDADLAQAQANSFTLRIDNIKLANARSLYPGLVGQYENQLASDTDSFRVSFRSAYDTLVNTGIAYTNAVTEYGLKAAEITAAERRLSLGLISVMEYEGTKNELANLHLKEQNAYIAMLRAKAAYDAAVQGLL